MDLIYEILRGRKNVDNIVQYKDTNNALQPKGFNELFSIITTKDCCADS